LARLNSTIDAVTTLTSGYLRKAEALLELAIEFAQERRQKDW
jgi:hypothetical protein